MSSLTGQLSGAPFSRQSGSSSFRAFGSMTAPARMCAPTSEPFSTTQTLISRPSFSASCFRWMAALSPAGPAPTITASYCILSRSMVCSMFVCSLVLFRRDYTAGRLKNMFRRPAVRAVQRLKRKPSDGLPNSMGGHCQCASSLLICLILCRRTGLPNITGALMAKRRLANRKLTTSTISISLP